MALTSLLYLPKNLLPHRSPDSTSTSPKTKPFQRCPPPAFTPSRKFWSRRCGPLAADSPSPSVAVEGEGSMAIDVLRQFIGINLGKWSGFLYQFDIDGNTLNKVSTRLSASSYGEDELISLIQTLYIKQAPSKTSFSDFDEKPEWVEYKIKETNMFTVDKYQQIGFFPHEKAFSLRYQTAGMLETVLRAGMLGEDDTGEDSPRNLKLPSRRPSLVCENCLYSLCNNTRARAFHIFDPKGALEPLLVFIEQMGEGETFNSDPRNSEDDIDRLSPFLGRWEGHSITKRSGLYGATITEAVTVALLEMDAKGQLTQDIASTSNQDGATTNVHWAGTISRNLINFDGGFQMTLLPRGMYMGCPSDVGKCVAQSQSFHLEFCWMESPNKRQRLVRTYDVEGQVVSSTYFFEVKV